MQRKVLGNLAEKGSFNVPFYILIGIYSTISPKFSFLLKNITHFELMYLNQEDDGKETNRTCNLKLLERQTLSLQIKNEREFFLKFFVKV